MIISSKKFPIAVQSLLETKTTGEWLKSEIKYIFDLMEAGFKVLPVITDVEPQDNLSKYNINNILNRFILLTFST